MTVQAPIEKGGITPEDDARMHNDIAEFLKQQDALGADPDVLADIGYHAVPSPDEADEDIVFSPGDHARMHVADFLLEQIAAGAEPEALEDLGYIELPEVPETETGTLEERAEAAVRSGRLLVTREIVPPAQPRPKQRRQPKKRPQQPQGEKLRKRRPARTAREKMARDMGSRPDLKPDWP